MAIDPAALRIREWLHDPVRQVVDDFGVTPDPWQVDALRQFPKSPRLAIKACVGPGKSALLTWLIWNFLATRPYPKIAATSITGDNLRDNLWAELAKWQRRSKFLQAAFVWTAERIYARESPEEWWASARTWNRAASPEEMGSTLSGLHSEYVLVVIDEAGGVPSAVADTGEQALSVGTEAHLVIAGNPTHRTGPLYDAFHDAAELWTPVSVTGDPDDPDRAPRVSATWARQIIANTAGGRDSYFVRTKILGLFPLGGENALVSTLDFEAAFGRTESKPIPDEDGVLQSRPLEAGLRRLGVDPGRHGGDPTVVVKVDGDLVLGFEEWARTGTTETARKVDRIALAGDFIEVAVDCIGLGAGVVDALLDMEGRPYTVIPVDAGASPTKRGPVTPEQPKGIPLYLNVRAQIGLETRGRFLDGTIALDESFRSTTLGAESTDLKYGETKGRDVQRIEDKDDYRKRHKGNSPNYWDALALAIARLDNALDGLLEFYRRRRARKGATASKCLDCGADAHDETKPFKCVPRDLGPVLIRRR